MIENYLNAKCDRQTIMEGYQKSRQTIHTECLMGTGICYENDIIALPCSHKHLLPLGHDDKVCDPFCFLFVFGLSIL